MIRTDRWPQIVLVHPATSTDRYQNTTRSYDSSAGATRTTIRGAVQQQNRAETVGGSRGSTDGRSPAISGWLLLTNHTGVTRYDRIEYDGQTFEVDGRPDPVRTPRGVHHVEATLTEVEG